MASSLDETELARLEKLKADSDNNRKVYGGDTIATVWYQNEAANAVPSLVAEVRRLRRNYECSEKSLQRHEQIVAELMEKVEALVKEKLQLKAMTFALAEQHGKGNIGKIQRALEWADEEAKKREAVHADRE